VEVLHLGEEEAEVLGVQAAPAAPDGPREIGDVERRLADHRRDPGT